MDSNLRLRSDHHDVTKKSNLSFSNRETHTTSVNRYSSSPQHQHHMPLTTTRNQGPGNNEQSTPDFASEQSRRSESTPSNETHEGGVEVAASIGGILEEMSRGVSYEDHDANDPLAELKRPRACDACRQLKVRCVFENDISPRPCKRCAKANRKCTVTPPVRKRQKKTENRVSELEKKIEALTATLQASSRAESMVSPDAASQDQARTTASTRRWMGDGPPPASSISPRIGTKRTSSGDAKFSALPGHSFMGPAPSAKSPSDSVTHHTNEFIDIIDRGLIDVQTAVNAFNHYLKEIAPKLPIVVFLPGTTMASIRRHKPILFLVIMAIAMGHFRSELQTSLVREVHRVFADSVIVKGEKSLELVQAIMLACVWYMPPAQFEELKFFQFIYMAVVMALDIGMGRVTRRKGNKHHGFLREIIGKSQSKASFDPDAVETRRIWIGAYLMAVNASMALRRPLLCRWSPYMDECIDILQSSPEAHPSDRTLIHWAKLSRISEEIGFQFSMDDPSSNLSLNDTKVQYAMKGFERQLNEWRRGIADEDYTPLLQHAGCITDIYMHEIAMQNDMCNGDSKSSLAPDFNKNEATSDKATTAQIDALTTCLTSIHRALDCVLSVEPEVLVNMPTYTFARSAYAFIALLKMFSAVSSDQGLERVFSLADFKLEDYFEKLINHLKVSSNKLGGRTASRFCMVLTLLRNWFHNRKIEKVGEKAEEISTSASQQGPTNSQQVSQTPVATTTPERQTVEPGINGSDKPQLPTTSAISDPPQWAYYNVSGPDPSPAVSSSFFPQQYQFNETLQQYPENVQMTNNFFPTSQEELFTFPPEFEGFQLPINAEGILSMGGGMLPDNVFDLPFDDSMNFYMQ